MRNQIAPLAEQDGPNGYVIWSGTLDLSHTNAGFSCRTLGFSNLSAQATLTEGSWGSAVIEMVRSNDDDKYHAFSPAKEFAADGVLDFDDYANGFLGPRIKTAGTGLVDITIYARKD